MRELSSLWLFVGLILVVGCKSNQALLTFEVDPTMDISLPIEEVYIDNLQNIFVLTLDNRVIKFNSTFEEKYEFSNNLDGDIVHIDATNPQKILCFIKDFNRIVVLDNTLAKINTIDLSNSKYLDVSSVGRSNDNKIWLFDPINQSLVKVNDFLEIQYESNRMSDYNLGNINPIILKEKDNVVVMSDPKIGIFVFDNFGQFLKFLPEENVIDFQVFNDYLFFVQGSKCYQYDFTKYEKNEIVFGIDGFENFKMGKDAQYFIYTNGIRVLDIN